jgi:hypothetical protein
MNATQAVSLLVITSRKYIDEQACLLWSSLKNKLCNSFVIFIYIWKYIGDRSMLGCQTKNLNEYTFSLLEQQ